MIEVKNLSKSFGDLKVLDKVDLTINDGDVIALIGPSGCGKTTFLRCLNLLERVQEGEMIFDGVSYNLATIKNKQISQIRSKTGFVFQTFNLFENKTALQNITEGLIATKKADKQQANEIAYKLLEKVGLTDKADYYPNQLSGGQKQRVAIARALATNPEIIYFDEPTSALDPELINEVLKVIKELSNEKLTMLIVTHEINFAKNVSNRILFIDKGKIIADEKTEDFFNNPKHQRVIDFLSNLGGR